MLLHSCLSGPQSPPSLMDICADYVRTNLDSVLDLTTFKGVPQGTVCRQETLLFIMSLTDLCFADLIDYVVFKRDSEGHLRGQCKLCRPGKCCTYRVQQSDEFANFARPMPVPCDCGHSNFHHELIEDSSTFQLVRNAVVGSDIDPVPPVFRPAGLFGKKQVDSTSAKGILSTHYCFESRVMIANCDTCCVACSYAPLRLHLQAPVRLDVVVVVVRHLVFASERMLRVQLE